MQTSQQNNDTLNTAYYMQEHKATKDNFELARNGLYKQGIKTSYDESRMIFKDIS